MEKTLAYYSDQEKLLVAVDSIIFGFDDGELQLLLFKRKVAPLKDKWSLIGRFVKPDEDVRQAASEVLYDHTGLKNIFLEQLFAFGNVDRDPGARVISIGYYALIRINEYEKNIVEEYDSRWFPLSKIPDLILDHSTMVQRAHRQLVEKIKHYPVGAELLPTKFTLPQLFQLYQAIHGRKLDDRNFRKKILSMKILNKLDEKEKSTSRKGAYLYEFDQEKYERLLTEGYDFRI